LVFIETVSLIV